MQVVAYMQKCAHALQLGNTLASLPFLPLSPETPCNEIDVKSFFLKVCQKILLESGCICYDYAVGTYSLRYEIEAVRITLKISTFMWPEKQGGISFHCNLAPVLLLLADVVQEASCVVKLSNSLAFSHTLIRLRHSNGTDTLPTIIH